MPVCHFTDRFVAGAKVGDYFDAKVRGFNFRVTDKGVRSWFLVFTNPADGKRARVTLGHYPEISLARARTMALEARVQIEEGHDPRNVERPGSGSMTVADLAASYVTKYARPNLRSAAGVELCLKTTLPLIGSIPIANLHRRDLTKALDPILERGAPSQAVRVFKIMRSMLNWAVEQGILDASPLPPRAKQPAIEKPRERYLEDEEIAVLWAKLPSLSKQSHRDILKLCLITGQRLGEVTGIRSGEVDLVKSVWVIPAERSKNGDAHAVPLSDLAMAIIRPAIVPGVDHPLFPDAGKPNKVGSAVRDAQPDFGLQQWTIHDLRRTVVTGLQRLGVQPIVAAAVINHRSTTKAGTTMSVYARYDYAKEKSEALDLWAHRLTAIIAGDAAKVVNISEGKRG